MSKVLSELEFIKYVNEVLGTGKYARQAREDVVDNYGLTLSGKEFAMKISEQMTEYENQALRGEYPGQDFINIILFGDPSLKIEITESMQNKLNDVFNWLISTGYDKHRRQAQINVEERNIQRGTPEWKFQIKEEFLQGLSNDLDRWKSNNWENPTTNDTISGTIMKDTHLTEEQRNGKRNLRLGLGLGLGLGIPLFIMAAVLIAILVRRRRKPN